MAQLCVKSRILIGYLELLIEENLSSKQCLKTCICHVCIIGHVTIVTSKDVSERGCQLSVKFSCPLEDIAKFVKERGVMVRSNSCKYKIT